MEYDSDLPPQRHRKTHGLSVASLKALHVVVFGVGIGNLRRARACRRSNSFGEHKTDQNLPISGEGLKVNLTGFEKTQNTLSAGVVEVPLVPLPILQYHWAIMFKWGAYNKARQIKTEPDGTHMNK